MCENLFKKLVKSSWILVASVLLIIMNIIHISAPACTFAWIPKSNSDQYRSNEAINLPLYHTNMRDKILTFVQVPSGGDENKWLQAGAVLFLDDQL